MKPKTFWLIFALGTILRIAWINVPPLWYDENFTLLLARLPFSQMMQATATDVHPPLWYIIEWIFSHAMTNAAWTVRIPALICSIASLIAFRVLLADLKIPEPVQVGAMVLMAVMPFQLWYAQEGRMYALLQLEVILAFMFMFRSEWIKLSLVSVAMLYTQNYGVFYLATIGLVSLVMQLEIAYWLHWVSDVVKVDRHIILNQLKPSFYTAAAMLLAVLCYVPWLFVLRSQMLGIQDRYWIVAQGIGAILIIIYKLFLTASIPAPLLMASYLVTFGTLIVGTYHFVRSTHPARTTIFIMAFVPLVLAGTVSYLWQPVLLFRAFIGITPFLYIVACWWLPKANTDKAFASLVIAPLIVASVYGYYVNISAMKGEGAVSSMSDALAYVESNWQDGDVIYATDDGPWVNLTAYTTKTIYRMPECDEPVLGSLSLQTRVALGMQVIDLRAFPHQRAWIFAPFSPLHPTCYDQQVHALTDGTKPVYVVDDNEWLHSAVWLVEK